MSTEKKNTVVDTSMDYSAFKRPIPFMKISPFVIIASCLIITAGIVTFFIKAEPGVKDGKFQFNLKKALNLGLDFQGGARVQAKFKDAAIQIQNIRKVFTDAKIQANINTIGDPRENTYMITTPITTQVEAEQVDVITAFLKKSFDKAPVTNITGNATNIDAPASFEIIGSELVQPKEGAAFAGRAMLLLGLVSVLIMIYVAIRFSLNYGTGAVLALFHDMLIMMSFLVFFDLSFDITIVASLLTILGFSINDTIVVFDRIREIRSINKDEDFGLVIDKSITQTLSRTIITSLTVFFVATAIWLWGGEVLKNFGFMIMIGVLSGTYSSIMIASPITYAMTNAFEKGKKAPAKQKA